MSTSVLVPHTSKTSFQEDYNLVMMDSTPYYSLKMSLQCRNDEDWYLFYVIGTSERYDASEIIYTVRGILYTLSTFLRPLITFGLRL